MQSLTKTVALAGHCFQTTTDRIVPLLCKILFRNHTNSLTFVINRNSYTAVTYCSLRRTSTNSLVNLCNRKSINSPYDSPKGDNVRSPGQVHLVSRVRVKQELFCTSDWPVSEAEAVKYEMFTVITLYLTMDYAKHKGQVHLITASGWIKCFSAQESARPQLMYADTPGTILCTCQHICWWPERRKWGYEKIWKLVHWQLPHLLGFQLHAVNSRNKYDICLLIRKK